MFFTIYNWIERNGPTLAFEVLRYGTMVYTYASSWASYLNAPESPETRYFLGDTEEVYTDQTIVPEGEIFVSQWTSLDGNTKTYVRYAGESIPASFPSPFDTTTQTPWSSIFDEEYNVITLFDVFVVRGNVIRPELVKALYPNHTLTYLDRSLNTHEFPGESITIE